MSSISPSYARRLANGKRLRELDEREKARRELAWAMTSGHEYGTVPQAHIEMLVGEVVRLQRDVARLKRRAGGL